MGTTMNEKKALDQSNKSQPDKYKSDKKCKDNPSKQSEIGREGAGVLGQNWTESPDSAKKGRYQEDPKIPSKDPNQSVDTDISQAV